MSERGVLNCPCHTTATTALAVTGELLVHQLPLVPAPLPHVETREVNGTIPAYAAGPSMIAYNETRDGPQGGPESGARAERTGRGRRVAAHHAGGPRQTGVFVMDGDGPRMVPGRGRSVHLPDLTGG